MLGLAEAAKAEVAQGGDEYARGRLMGLYEAVSLLVQQAGVFGIDLEEVGLAGVDPDRYLL